MSFYIDGVPVEAFEKLREGFYELEVRHANAIKLDDFGIKKGEQKFILTGFECSISDGRSCGFDELLCMFGIKIVTEKSQIDVCDSEKYLEKMIDVKGFAVFCKVFEFVNLEDHLDNYPDDIYQHVFETSLSDFSEVTMLSKLSFIYLNDNIETKCHAQLYNTNDFIIPYLYKDEIIKFLNSGTVQIEKIEPHLINHLTYSAYTNDDISERMKDCI